MRFAAVILLILAATPSATGSTLNFEPPVAIAGQIDGGNATWMVVRGDP